jgi:hypothetical protein
MGSLTVGEVTLTFKKDRCSEGDFTHLAPEIIDRIGPWKSDLSSLSM